jgi:putative heme iron utilization protein
MKYREVYYVSNMTNEAQEMDEDRNISMLVGKRNFGPHFLFDMLIS